MHGWVIDILRSKNSPHSRYKVLSECETMGSATKICSDKTRALTLNQVGLSHWFISMGMISSYKCVGL